ncbi:MAG: hypothetical protein ACKOXB_02645 [Flavobacteriales bacterium]
MVKFIRDYIVFTLIVIIGVFLMAFIYFKVNHLDIKYLSSPKISNSDSFNDKISYLSKRTAARNIALGSSLSLENLNSQSIIHYIGSTDYINTASWGMTMKEDFILLKGYCNRAIPSRIFMSSDIVDFQLRSFEIDEQDMNNLLQSKKLAWLYLKHPDFRDYLETSNLYRDRKSTDTIKETLKYDDYGAILYPYEYFHTPKLNVEAFIKGAPIPKEPMYQFLDSICAFSSRNNIKIYFFQNPLCESYTAVARQKYYRDHARRVAKILQSHNHFYLDPNDTTWADSLFMDGMHLNEKGSKLYTDYCLRKIQ